MTKYLVAVDSSSSSFWAFNFAVDLYKQDHGDEIYLLGVAEKVHGVAASYLKLVGAEQEVGEAQRMEENRVRMRLLAFCDQLKRRGIGNFTAVMGTSAHAGDMICRAVLQKGIHCLVIGQRGQGLMQRVWAGSTSRYCLENAHCNVILVKEEYGPDETHDVTATAAKRAEQIERLRRMEEDKAREAQHKFQSDLDRHIASLAEEEERLRRKKDDESRAIKELRDREAAHIGAVVAEEEERKRREKEEAVHDDRVHRVEIFE